MPFTQQDKDDLQEQVSIILAVMDLDVDDLETAEGLINLYAELTRRQGEIIVKLVAENEMLNQGLRNEGL